MNPYQQAEQAALRIAQLTECALDVIRLQRYSEDPHRGAWDALCRLDTLLCALLEYALMQMGVFARASEQLDAKLDSLQSLARLMDAILRKAEAGELTPERLERLRSAVDLLQRALTEARNINATAFQLEPEPEPL